MRKIVLKFFSEDQELTREELDILKWHIGRFLSIRPHKPPGWKERLASCSTKEELKQFTRMLDRDYGLDPF